MDVTVYTLDGNQVTREELLQVLSKLNSGDYVFGINKCFILDLDKNLKPIYQCELETTTDSPYEFEESDY